MTHGGTHLAETAKNRGLSVRTPSPVPQTRVRGDNILSDIGNVLVNVAAGMQGRPFPALAQAQNQSQTALARFKADTDRFQAIAGLFNQGVTTLLKLPEHLRGPAAEGLANFMGRVEPGLADSFRAFNVANNPKEAQTTFRILEAYGPELAALTKNLPDEEIPAFLASSPVQAMLEQDLKGVGPTAKTKVGALIPHYFTRIGVNPSDPNQVKEVSSTDAKAFIDNPIPLGDQFALTTKEKLFFERFPEQLELLFVNAGIPLDRIKIERAAADAARAPTAKALEDAELQALGVTDPGERSDIINKRRVLAQDATGAQRIVSTRTGEVTPIQEREPSPRVEPAKPKETLAQLNERLDITGLKSKVTELAAKGLGQVGIDIGLEVVQARQTFRTTQISFLNAIKRADRYVQGEIDLLKQEVDLSPAVYDSKPAMRARIVSIRDTLTVREINERNRADDNTLDKKRRNASRATALAIREFLVLLGDPNALSSVPAFNTPAAVGDASLGEIQTFVEGASNADLDALSPATRAAISRKLGGE